MGVNGEEEGAARELRAWEAEHQRVTEQCRVTTDVTVPPKRRCDRLLYLLPSKDRRAKWRSSTGEREGSTAVGLAPARSGGDLSVNFRVAL